MLLPCKHSDFTLNVALQSAVFNFSVRGYVCVRQYFRMFSSENCQLVSFAIYKREHRFVVVLPLMALPMSGGRRFAICLVAMFSQVAGYI